MDVDKPDKLKKRKEENDQRIRRAYDFAAFIYTVYETRLTFAVCFVLK